MRTWISGEDLGRSGTLAASNTTQWEWCQREQILRMSPQPETCWILMCEGDCSVSCPSLCGGCSEVVFFGWPDLPDDGPECRAYQLKKVRSPPLPSITFLVPKLGLGNCFLKLCFTLKRGSMSLLIYYLQKKGDRFIFFEFRKTAQAAFCPS
ncbi:hypothetical protein GKODMF_01130 [Candidatus Electrothrix gigas]